MLEWNLIPFLALHWMLMYKSFKHFKVSCYVTDFHILQFWIRLSVFSLSFICLRWSCERDFPVFWILLLKHHQEKRLQHTTVLCCDVLIMKGACFMWNRSLPVFTSGWQKLDEKRNLEEENSVIQEEWRDKWQFVENESGVICLICTQSVSVPKQ